MELPQSRNELFLHIRERMLAKPISFVAALYEYVDEVTLLIDEIQEPKSACAPGCNFCCFQPIIATAWEWQEILQYLSSMDARTKYWVKRRFQAARTEWFQWLRGYNSRFKPPDSEDIIERWKGKPCVFLNSQTGRCDIYPVRVLVCRTTYNVIECDSFLTLRSSHPLLKWANELLKEPQKRQGRLQVAPLMEVLCRLTDRDW